MLKIIFSIFLFVSFSFSAFKDTLIDFNQLGTFENDPDEVNRLIYNGNWSVRLNASSDFLGNRELSHAKNVEIASTKDNQIFLNGGSSGNVLGVRVNFPPFDSAAYATVKPFFEFLSHSGEDGNQLVGKGVLKNVGNIKYINSYVKGKNFPHSLYIYLRNEDGALMPFFMGYLNYSGWRNLQYQNPNYLENVRFRDTKPAPLEYPRLEPLIKLDSIKIRRSGEAVSGDFVTYIGWITMEYDKAIITGDEEADIDDEAVWGILTETTARLQKKALEKIRIIKESRELERKRMNLDDSSEEAN